MRLAGGISTADPSAVSDAFAPQDGADAEPDADAFIEKARAAVAGKTPDDEPVTDISLIDGDLHIKVDYSGSSTFTEFENWSELLDTFLINSNNALVEPILALGEQYDVLWNTITVDFGEYGKVVNEKSAVAVMDMSEYGIDRQARYFPSENSAVIHDSPIPSAPVVEYTSPPVVTNPPVTAAPEQKTERMVWIPTQGGSKYHSNSSCSGMNGPVEVTISEAEARGFEPCGKCF